VKGLDGFPDNQNMVRIVYVPARNQQEALAIFESSVRAIIQLKPYLGQRMRLH